MRCSVENSSSWRQCTLEDLGEIVGGGTPSTKNPSFYGGEIPWITPKDLSVLRERFISHGERNITSSGLRNSAARLIPGKSVLFTSRAPIGYVAIAQNEVCTNQGFKSIIPNDKTDPLFLYYLLIYNRSKIEAMGSGTTFKEVSGSVMRKVPVFVPEDVSEQKRIAAILSALDDKIENNKRINRTLEQMVQALFKSWFIDFEPFGGKMPREWRMGRLSDIANITMGQSPAGSSYRQDGIGTVFYQGRAEFGWRFPTRRLFTTQPKRLAQAGDILMSVRAPVGDINVANEACCLGRGIAGIRSKSDYQSFILYTMFSLRSKLDTFNGEGTVFGSISKNDLASLPVIIPSTDVLSKFEQTVAPLDAMIESNSSENRRLAALRDTLLPRLMSGDTCALDINRNNNLTKSKER